MVELGSWRRYRVVAGLVILIGVGLSWPGVKDALAVNNSLEIWFDGDSPALDAYRVYQERFGSDEQVLVMLTLRGGGLDTTESRRLRSLHDALLALDEVASVQSPADLAIPERRLSGLVFEQLLDHAPERQLILLDRFPIIKQQVFSPELDACKLVVQLNADLDIDAQRGAMVDAIKQVVAEHWSADGYALGGISVVFAALNALTEAQFGLYVPITYGVMLLFLWFVARSWRVCAIALATMTTATVISLGAYGWLGHQLNLMTVLIPMVILLLSSLDLMHLLYAWKSRPGAGLEGAIGLVWRPALLTTVTTMLGFLSLLFSPMAILQEFGLYSALGIGLCLPLTYVFAAWLWPQTPTVTQVERADARAQRWQNWLATNRLAVGTGFGVSLLIFIIGISQLRSDTYTLGYLPDDHPVVQDHEKIQATFGAYIPLELLLQPKDGSSFKDSLTFYRLTSLASELAAAGYEPQIGLPQLIELTARQYGAQTPEAVAAKAAVSMATLERRFERWLDLYYDQNSETARLTVFGEMMSAGELGDNIRGMQAIGADASVTMQPAGYLPLYAQLVPYATESQVVSLGMAALLIGLLLWMYFKSWVQMLVVLATQIFPLAGMFGLMGWFGIELDIATASIACIGLSYCVDDSIHFALGYRRHRRLGESHEASMVSTLSHTGHAIVLSSFMLMLGFACMLFSPLKTVYLFGLLSCIMVGLALVSQLVLFGFLQRTVRAFE